MNHIRLFEQFLNELNVADTYRELGANVTNLVGDISSDLKTLAPQADRLSLDEMDKSVLRLLEELSRTKHVMAVEKVVFKYCQLLTYEFLKYRIDSTKLIQDNRAWFDKKPFAFNKNSAMGSLFMKNSDIEELDETIDTVVHNVVKVQGVRAKDYDYLRTTVNKVLKTVYLKGVTTQSKQFLAESVSDEQAPLAFGKLVAFYFVFSTFHRLRTILAKTDLSKYTLEETNAPAEPNQHERPESDDATPILNTPLAKIATANAALAGAAGVAKLASYVPKFFQLDDFDSPDQPGSNSKMRPEILKIMDELREFMNKPIRINSGYRSLTHNRKVGGVGASSHMNGSAVDFSTRNFNHDEKKKAITKLKELGVKRFGIANTYIHIDIDETKSPYAVWSYNNKIGDLHPFKNNA